MHRLKLVPVATHPCINGLYATCNSLHHQHSKIQSKIKKNGSEKERETEKIT